MPTVYSDIEVSAKIVFTDPNMFQELSRELHDALESRPDFRAIRDTLPQIDALIERLENMHIL